MNVEDIDAKTYAELSRISNSPSAEARLVARCKIILSFLDQAFPKPDQSKSAFSIADSA